MDKLQNIVKLKNKKKDKKNKRNGHIARNVQFLKPESQIKRKDEGINYSNEIDSIIKASKQTKKQQNSQHTEFQCQKVSYANSTKHLKRD